VWTLVLTTLDVSLSNGRDVGPSHVIGWHCQRKLELPDQGTEDSFDSEIVEFRVGNRLCGAVGVFHLLINSELKPDASPRATHERHLVSPNARGLHHAFGSGLPPVWAANKGE
jgi:hypothetical protein